MDISAMAGWPGVPGPERFAMAERLIQDDPDGVDEYSMSGSLPLERLRAPFQTYRDARMMLGLVDMLFFSEWAHEEMGSMINAEQFESPQDLMEMLSREDPGNYIPIVIHMRPEHWDEDESDEFIITCLHQDPEWVGLNPQLPYCKGLEVHIFSRLGEPGRDRGAGHSHRRAPGGHGNREETGQEPTGEMAQAIRDAAMWHGAEVCLHHRWEPEKTRETTLSSPESS